MANLTPHVCIVGAGVSGLRCAEILLEHGYKVTIIEARDRIGGRIHQSDKLGYKVDIGPNWIHTSDGAHPNPILALAKKTNTPLHHWNDKQNIFDTSGQLIPADKAEKLSSLLWLHIKHAFQHSETNNKDISATESLHDFLDVKAREEFPDSKADEELLLEMAELWGCYTGDSVTKQSLKFIWLDQVCGGEDDCFVETTWEAILAGFARIPLAKADVRLGQKVVAIQTKDRSVHDSKVTLTVERGESLEFDEVVLSTPLGWLKRNQGAFDPPLPDRLIAGIKGISIGHLEKVFITFPSAFWLNARKPNEDVFPGYTNWLSPTYTPSTNPSSFGVEMWNLASFAPPNNHPTMIFYIYGACSEYLINLVHNQPTPSHHELLDAFFKPYYSLLPNFSESDPNCKPEAILSTEWQKDELSGYGSYCNFQVGAEDASGDIEAMRYGVPERRLWFCGEHTAPFEESGTVVGAYLSGGAVAERIVKINRERLLI